MKKIYRRDPHGERRERVAAQKATGRIRALAKEHRHMEDW
jgi:hypothetical protein